MQCLPGCSRQPELGDVLSAAHTASGGLLDLLHPVDQALAVKSQVSGGLGPALVVVEECKKRLAQRRLAWVVARERAQHAGADPLGLAVGPSQQRDRFPNELPPGLTHGTGEAVL